MEKQARSKKARAKAKESMGGAARARSIYDDDVERNKRKSSKLNFLLVGCDAIEMFHVPFLSLKPKINQTKLKPENEF